MSAGDWICAAGAGLWLIGAITPALRRVGATWRWQRTWRGRPPLPAPRATLPDVAPPPYTPPAPALAPWQLTRLPAPGLRPLSPERIAQLKQEEWT